jgi:EAL domain-containing protein (putative c-di-GMP-specific phosphodiesterase class I)
MKIKTIAELVESQEIAYKLREIGVDFVQGFGIAQPQPLNALKETSD